MEQLRLKGIIVDKKILEERYEIQLSDLEWRIFCNSITKSWNSKEFELDRIINKHVINSLMTIGFRSEIRGKDIVLTKKD